MDFKFRLVDLTREFADWLGMGVRRPGLANELQNMMLDALDEKTQERHQYVAAREFSQIGHPDAEVDEGLREIADEIRRVAHDAALLASFGDDADKVRKHFRRFMDATDNRKKAKAFIKGKFLIGNPGTFGGFEELEIVYPTVDELRRLAARRDPSPYQIAFILARNPNQTATAVYGAAPQTGGAASASEYYKPGAPGHGHAKK